MPLIKSGMALVASSIVTSGLGFIFWIVAARQYSSADLGIGSAVITAMILLTDISQLGLKTGLVRFLPQAGGDRRRLIVSAYAIAIGVAIVGSLIFVAGVNLWTPDLAGLRESVPLTILFVLSTAFWVVFLLEDSVLLGLRLAPWVPVENGIFGVLKIVLLFPLAAVSDEFGAFLAWALPVFAIVIVVNVFIRRPLRREAGEPSTARRGGSSNGASAPVANGATPSAAVSSDSGAGSGKRVDLREVLSYSAIDWTASAARTAVVGILPLLVLATLGSRQSAYYFLAWTITYSVYILSANIGDALVAEASYDQENVDRHTLHSGLLSMAISVPIVAVAVAVAPWVLQAFGSEYAEAATGALRLLLLGAIPHVITRTYVGRLRAERRMRAVFLYEFAISASVLALGWGLLGSLGILGLGVAWLVTLTFGALYVLIAESTWWWAPKLDPSLVRVASRLAQPFRSAALRLPSPTRDREVAQVLGRQYQSRPRWRRTLADADLQSLAVAGHDGRPPLRVELARSDWGDEVLARRNQATADLGELTGTAALRALVPFPIDLDQADERRVLIESALTGETGYEAADRHPVDELVAAVLEPIGDLHEATAGWLTFDAAALDRWVSQPLRHLTDSGRVEAEQTLAIGRMICEALSGKMVPSARIHGNLTLDNALFDPGGRLTGLINWEWSDTGPAFLDRASLALSARSVDTPRDVGHVVRSLLEEPEPLISHPAMADDATGDLDGRALVLLTWLHQLQPQLRSTSDTQAARFRLARSLTPVIGHPLVRETTSA